jgi:hypothetical protein
VLSRGVFDVGKELRLLDHSMVKNGDGRVLAGQVNKFESCQLFSREFLMPGDLFESVVNLVFGVFRAGL